MRTRTSGQTGLALLLLATVLTVADWLPAPRAEAIPDTIVREIAVAPSALRAGTALRAAGQGRIVAERRAITEARVVCAPIRFTSVGLLWDQPSGRSPAAVIEAGETETSFRRVMHAHDAEGPDLRTPDAARAGRATDPIWVESARCLRFSLDIPAGVTISNLRAMFINTSGTAGVPTEWRPAPAGAAVGGPGVANAQANAPYWVTRAGWGANEALRNCGPSYADQLKMAFVHHTATENGYAADKSDDIVRSIYAFHTEGRGWCDIAYNFLVDRFGKVFVGRFGGPAQNVIGAAQQGFNTGAVSVAGIGTYGSTAPNSMVYGIKKTLAWRLDVAHLPPKGWAWMVSGGGPNTKYAEGVGVTLPLISGHRNTGYTDCPGDKLFSLLPSIRQGANDIGLPKMWRTKTSATSFSPGLETVHITANGSASLKWTVTVASVATGQTMRTWRPVGTTLDVEWNGMDGLLAVPDGDYTVTIAATNAAGALARPAKLTVTVGGGAEAQTSPSPGATPTASP